jgi:transcriptional antiterminator NusG
VRCKEEELLMKLTKGKDEVGMSQGIIRDGVLKIQEGALTGLESRVKKIDRHKRKGYITVRLNDEEMTAEIGLEIKEKT